MKIISFNFFRQIGIDVVLFFLFIFLLTPLKNKAFVSDSTIQESKHFKFPVISIGEGLLNFSGDVGYNRLNEPLLAHSGFQIEIQPQTEKRYSFSLFILSGKMVGDEKTYNRAVNFSSSVFNEGLMFRYDFMSRKRDDQVLIPFLTAGIEYMIFRSKTDLTDANGVKYNYWTDGTIRDIDQNNVNSDQAKLIYRDYNYESDLREANLDGFGKYSTSTWGIPLGAGVRFKVSDNCAFHFSSVCHFTGTDYIDGITSESKGSRQGNSKNDKFFYTSISFRYTFTSHKEENNNIDFNALVNEDADGDGIPDIDDDSSGTPRNNAVTVNGKPYDSDNDGIPDYRDKEPNSASDAVVNEDGVTITEDMIEAKFRKDSLAALPAVIEYIQSYDKLTKRNPDVEKKWIEKNSAGVKSGQLNQIPPLYRKLDLDGNGIITPKEIGVAIDDYLAKRTKFTVSEFFDLIDFFFTQR